MYALGVLLFALAIAASIMLHEAGHMVSAKRFGMKVTQYFLGFGPTLWSFKRGETEYGVKAIPAGGFVKIIGMTPLEDDGEKADEPRAFWRAPVWKRTIVLSAGSLTHFALGFVLLYICALVAGLPVDPRAEPAKLDAVSTCLVVNYDTTASGDLRECRADDPAGPAKAAGLRAGDEIVAVGSTSTPTQYEMLKAIRTSPPGPTTVTYVRSGQRKQTTIELMSVNRPPLDSTDANAREQVSAIGVLLAQPEPTRTYGPVESLDKTVFFTGQFFKGTFTAIANFPQKIPPLIDALNPSAYRDPNGPISVIGASRLGGEALATKQPGGATTFLLILAGLNFFIGVFNLFPLLPLDGGHIAVIWFEKVRSWFAARLGRADPGRVDYVKLLPVTYVVIILFGGISLLTIAADIVNPVRLFQ